MLLLSLTLLLIVAASLTSFGPVLPGEVELVVFILLSLLLGLVVGVCRYGWRNRIPAQGRALLRDLCTHLAAM